MSVLLDSDVIIDYLNNQASKEIEELIDSNETIFTTAMNVYEINKGLEDTRVSDLIFSRFEIISITQPISELAAKIYNKLRKKGNLVNEFDIVIGAAALYHNFKIITRNKKDFERIQKIMKKNS